MLPRLETSSAEMEMERFSELPDDTGDIRTLQDLPDDSGESLPPELVQLKKQEYLYQEVKSGKLPLTDTRQKGNYGEIAADISMQEKGYVRLSKDRVTDLDAPGHEGIDGVYYCPGRKPPYIIADAKFNTAQLSDTKDGKQMSFSWIDARLDQDVGKEQADEIRMAMLDGDVDCYIIRIGKNNDVGSSPVYEKLNENGDVIARGEDLIAS